MPYLSDDEIDRRIALQQNNQVGLQQIGQSNRPSWMPPQEDTDINEERTLGGTLKDIGISGAKGIVDVGQAAIGLADIVTPGQLGKAIEDTGFDLGAAQEYLSAQYSPAQKAANARVESVKGFLPTLGTMLANPSTITQSVIESLPSMFAGGAIGKGLISAGTLASPLAGAAIGEGVVSGGQTAENIRRQAADRNLSLGQAVKATAAGIGTGIFGAVGGSIAKRFGLANPDELFIKFKLGKAAAESAKQGNLASHVAGRIVGGGITEGVFEELPQSMQEQLWMNAALDKPLMEGVKEAGAAGLLAGAAMGSGANIFTSITEPDIKSDLSPEEQQLADIDKQILDKINSVKPEEMTTEFFAELNELEKQRANLKKKPKEDERYEQPLSDDLDTINKQIANLEASGRDTVETKNLLNELYMQKENLITQIEDAPWDETKKEIERQQRVRDYPNKVQAIKSDETLTDEEKTNQLLVLKEQYNQDYKPRDFAYESRAKIQKKIEKLSTGTFIPADQAELDTAMDDLMIQYEQLAKEETDIKRQENILNNQKRVLELDKQVKDLQEQKPLEDRTNIENRFNILSIKENQTGLTKNEKTELTTLKGKLTKDNNRIAAIEKLNNEMSQLFTDTDEALAARFQRDFDIQRQERQDQQEYQNTLYDNAKTFVQGQDKISPRGLMGQFDLTYQEAQQILQTLEDEGIVGPAGKANIRNVGSISEQQVQPVGTEEVTSRVESAQNLEQAPNTERKTFLQDEIFARQSEISDLTDELEANKLEQSKLSVDDPMLADLKLDEENLNKTIQQKNSVLGLLQNRLDRGKFDLRSDIEPGQGISLSSIQKMYPNQEVFQTNDGKISVKFKNGLGATFQDVQDIGDGYIQLAIDTGQMDKNGLILGITQGNQVLLHKDYADDRTLWHENKHVLDNLNMITQADNSALTKEFNKLRKAGKLEFGLSTHDNPMRAMEENIANTFAQVMTSREQYRNTELGKLIQKIIDFFDSLLSFGQQSIRGLAREVESGRIYERPTIELEQATEIPQFKNVGNINSEEFKSWFGKSVAKKKTGEPVLFYHGSPNEFTVFEDRPAASTQKTASGLGHFFTMDRNYAAGYSKGSGNLIEAYLKMEKPYKMSLDESDKFTSVQQAVNRKNELKSKGYDSIILQIPGAQPIITVFDSNQVKSTKNRGTWNINNPDINFQAINPSDINTQAFKDWFGDSKVVNNEGKPLVVYQGRSTKGLDVLQNPKGDVWATDVKESAENFADIQERYYPNRPKDQQVEREMRGEIYPLYMNLQNPKTISHKITLWNPTKEAEQISLAKQEGYDGLIIQHDNGKKDFVAFNPNQVKSIFNRGTWDKKYPNINFEVRQKFGIPEQEIPQTEYDRMRIENRNIVGKVKQFMRSKGHEVNRTLNKYLGMTSTNLAKIHPMLQAKVRRLDFDTLQRVHTNLKDSLPVLEAVNKMSKNDKSDWDWAVKNSDAGKILSLANKYNFTEQYQTLRATLDQIHKDLIDVGYKPGFVDTYWPRLLKDREGFLQATREISRDPVFTQALQEKANKLGTSIENLDPDVRAEIIGQKIMEIKSGIGGPANVQGRVYDKIPPDLGKYYMDSSASLVQYIYSTAKNIEARKFFGRVPTKISNAKQIVRRGYNRLTELNNTYDLLSSQDRDTTDIRNKIKEVQDNIKLSEELIENYGQTRDFTENIGSYIDELRTSNLIDKKKFQENEATLKDILSARFHERGTSGIANIYKNISLLDTMGSPISALTQIQDLGWSIYVGGLTPIGITNTVRNIAKAINKQSDISKEDLGIEWIAQEFADADTFSRAVNKVFKITRLNYIDSIGKESLINNSYDNYKVKAKDRPKLFKEIRHMFSSDNETNQVITDLQNDNRASKNVQFLVFSRLLDFQPASKSEMPEKMLTAGNWRLAYLLKTFTLKQFDVFRRDVWHKLKSGKRDQIIDGLQNMAYLTSIMTFAGAGANELKDLLLGREIKFADHVIENFLTLGGANRYIRMQVNREGIGTALGKQILPPFKFIDNIYKDVSNNVTDLNSARFVDSIPVVGKLYYWHFGKGTEFKQSIAEQDFKKEGKDIKKFRERLNNATDKRAFIQANMSEFQTVRRHEVMQGNLNKITALINKLKKVPQTTNVTQRINQLESRKEQMYQRYGSYLN